MRIPTSITIAICAAIAFGSACAASHYVDLGGNDARKELGQWDTVGFGDSDFAPAAIFISDVHSILVSWLEGIRPDQQPDGAIPSIIPDVNNLLGNRCVGLGWSDAATLIQPRKTATILPPGRHVLRHKFPARE